MTEISEIKVLPFDPVAFVAALVLAPLLVTLVTCITIIPVFALVLGGPVYLIVGTPTLLWMVGRFPPDFSTFAVAGILGVFTLFGLTIAFHMARPDEGAGELLAIFVWGIIFAPLWAGSFAPIYRRLNRMARLAPLS